MNAPASNTQPPAKTIPPKVPDAYMENEETDSSDDEPAPDDNNHKGTAPSKQE